MSSAGLPKPKSDVLDIEKAPPSHHLRLASSMKQQPLSRGTLLEMLNNAQAQLHGQRAEFDGIMQQLGCQDVRMGSICKQLSGHGAAVGRMQQRLHNLDQRLQDLK